MTDDGDSASSPVPTSAARAVTAAEGMASALGLMVDDAVLMNDSNRFVVHLTPCDVVARVTPTSHHDGHHASATREVDLVAQLQTAGSPVATLDERVGARTFERDGFQVSLWTHYPPPGDRRRSAADYARALARLRTDLGQVEMAAPSYLQRVEAVERDVVTVDVTPELSGPDRDLLWRTIGELRQTIADRRAPEQLLHGEPHPDNLLDTAVGVRFIDFENAVRGPIEYDLGWVPRSVGDRYPEVDRSLLDACRGLVVAMVAAYRWRGDDQHPSGRRSGVAFLESVRSGPPWPTVDEVAW